MKILYWIPQFWPEIGGIEVLAMKTLPALQRRNHEFMIITSHSELDPADQTRYGNIPVYRFPFWRALAKRDLGQVVKIKQQIAALKRAFRPDLIHLHYPGHIAYFHVNTVDARPPPTLLTIHTPFPSARGDPDTLFGQTVRSAIWITAVSKSTLFDTIQIVPEIRSRSSVIYNGLPAPQLSPEMLPFRPPQILYVGRLAHEKGVDVAVSAFATIIKRFPRTRLKIVGGGPARSEIEQQVATLGLTDAVEFTGWIQPEKIPALINKCTLVVVPSRYREPFALIAVEAAQMARPVVAARTGGLPETVVHRQSGLLFENENTAALAKEMAFLLDHPDRAMQMGQMGRCRALKIFSLEKFVDAYDRLYLRLIKEAAWS
jgi:glycosyltransferase involved in cell wall biosynthesis